MKPLARNLPVAQVIAFPASTRIPAEYVEPEMLARRLRAEIACRLPELDLEKLLELGRLVVG